jgi:hypothetical protein
MKFGRFRLNMAQVALIERDEERLIFFNADGAQIFERRFDSGRQAAQALRDFFNFEEVRLLTARYEGTDVGDGTGENA